MCIIYRSAGGDDGGFDDCGGGDDFVYLPFCIDASPEIRCSPSVLLDLRVQVTSLSLTLATNTRSQVPLLKSHEPGSSTSCRPELLQNGGSGVLMMVSVVGFTVVCVVGFVVVVVVDVVGVVDGRMQ